MHDENGKWDYTPATARDICCLTRDNEIGEPPRSRHDGNSTDFYAKYPKNCFVVTGASNTDFWAKNANNLFPRNDVVTCSNLH